MDMGNVAKVFFKVWREVLEVKTELSVQTSFPPPSEDILEFWEKSGVDDKFILSVQEAIGVRVGCGYLLGEALIQKTFYDTLTTSLTYDLGSPTKFSVAHTLC